MTGLKVALASIFAYLTVKDGVADGNAVYAVLFALLTIEYIIELVEKSR